MKHAFLVTHFGSGGTLLCRLLNTSTAVCTLGASGLVYDHPTVLEKLRERLHAYHPLSGSCTYLDKIMMNHHFCCKNLYKFCKFVYLVRSPAVSIPNIMLKGYDAEHAADHYCFRLRRMCEMARNTPGGVLITYDDIIAGRTDALENYLDINKPLGRNFPPMYWDDGNLKTGEILLTPDEPQGYVPADVMSRCVKAYNKYLNFLEENLLVSSSQQLSWQDLHEVSCLFPP